MMLAFARFEILHQVTNLAVASHRGVFRGNAAEIFVQFNLKELNLQRRKLLQEVALFRRHGMEERKNSFYETPN